MNPNQMRLLIQQLAEGETTGWHEAVLDTHDPSVALPVGPTIGDRYLSTATGNGWVDADIYEWNGVSWTHEETAVGDVVFNATTSEVNRKTGATTWSTEDSQVSVTESQVTFDDATGHTHTGAGGNGSQVDHTDVLNIGTNTHAVIDTILAAARAKVYDSGAQNVGNAAWEALTFDSEDFDTASIHDNAVNPTRLTAPEDGLYLVIGKAAFVANANGTRRIEIYANGATVVNQNQVLNAGAGEETEVQVVALVALSAAEYVEVRVYQDTGGALNTVAGVTRTNAEIIRLA